MTNLASKPKLSALRGFFLLIISVACTGSLQAKLEIEIIKGNASALPIAVVPFQWKATGYPPITAVTEIINQDLYRSGLFKPMAEADMADRPAEAEAIRFGTWRLLQTDYLVIGSVRDAPGGNGYEIVYQLFDVHTQDQLLSLITVVGLGDLRFGAHRVADAIYEKLTGVPGAFSTRIAYVSATPKEVGYHNEIVVADADGFNPQSIVGSPEPLLSPAWSSNGERLAYVSFEKGNSAIYLQTVATGARELVSSGKGINGAPAFSPSGRYLALALSISGNLEIYIRDLATGDQRQLTNHWAIDTEPAWSPDSKTVYFTSDRGGRPQIYKVPVNGGKAERVTLEGDYNARATVAANGRSIAVAQGNGNEYRIGVWDLENKRMRILTPGVLDESPSFAPNSSMILYATKEGGRGVLSAVSADGNVRQRLILSEGDVREPAWSPVIR
ncbi:MAG: TolB protein [Lysobacterales bacterium]|jgi:TolB protein